MAYYNTCPDCGSNLDPGEKCDCRTTPNISPQNGHTHSIEDDTNYFARTLSDLQKHDPAAFVSTCALIQVMANGENENYGFQHPWSVFTGAIQYLENARKCSSEDPDIYIRAIALICDKWIHNATDAA